MIAELIHEALASYTTLFIACAVAGFPIPFPEEILVLMAGHLVASDALSFWPTVLVCGAGMLVRDLVAFAVARRFSRWLLARPRVRRMIGEKTIEAWSRLFYTRGALGVFLARFALGVRVKLYFVAAPFGVRWRTFILADLLGMLIFAPLTVWLGARFGEPLIEGVKRLIEQVGLVAGIVVALAIVVVIWRRRRAAAKDD